MKDAQKTVRVILIILVLLMVVFVIGEIIRPFSLWGNCAILIIYLLPIAIIISLTFQNKYKVWTKTFTIGYVFTVVFLIISLFFFGVWYGERCFEYECIIRVKPEINEPFEVFLPVPEDSGAFLDIISCKYGKCIRISSDKEVNITIKGRTGEWPYSLSMENRENRTSPDSIPFWVYGNFTNNSTANVFLSYRWEAYNYEKVYTINGTIKNGWQLVNGTGTPWI